MAKSTCKKYIRLKNEHVCLYGQEVFRFERSVVSHTHLELDFELKYLLGKVIRDVWTGRLVLLPKHFYYLIPKACILKRTVLP